MDTTQHHDCLIYNLGLCTGSPLQTLYGKNIIKLNSSKVNPRLQDQFKKWSHLPGVQPHWFWGNRRILSECFKDTFHNHYKALSGHRLDSGSGGNLFLFLFHFDRFGVFWYGTEPAIFLLDLDLIKKVQITDHDHFTDFGQSQSQSQSTPFISKLCRVFPRCSAE